MGAGMPAELQPVDPLAPPSRRAVRSNAVLPMILGAVGVWLFLALRLLPVDVMGERMWNEADVLPLARQSAEPTWIPNDWYLTQNAEYRFAFQASDARGFVTVTGDKCKAPTGG